MYRYFVFDMDGTLVDSTNSIIVSLEQMEKKLGLKPTVQDPFFRRRFIGPPLKESMMKYYGVTLKDTESLTEVYRNCYMEFGIEKTSLFFKVPELLTFLRMNGCHIAIATLKQHQLAQAILEFTGLELLVDYVSLNLDNTLGDKAAMIRTCLEGLGCTDFRQAVMVGDSPYDGQSAQEAGVDFIALSGGEGFQKAGVLEKTKHVLAPDTIESLYSQLSTLI